MPPTWQWHKSCGGVPEPRPRNLLYMMGPNHYRKPIHSLTIPRKCGKLVLQWNFRPPVPLVVFGVNHINYMLANWQSAARVSVAKHTLRELITNWAVALTCYISQWFSNFLTTDPFFLRYSWRTSALVTVKFTTSTKYTNSCAHRVLQTYQHHQLQWMASNVSVMDVLALRYTDWKHISRKLLKTVQTMTILRILPRTPWEPAAGPL